MRRNEIKSLEFNDLSLKAKSGAEVLTEVNLKFPLNDIVWVRGISGSGKSVIGKILAGLLMPDQGSYLVNELKVSEMTFEEFLPYRCNIGYSFDFGGLINNRDIINNLLLPIQYHNYDFGTADQLVEQVHKLLKIFGLDRVAHERPSAVAGRLRKAACVARAMIHKPEMLVLDDPTTGLRPEVCDQLAILIKQAREEGWLKHVFIITEDEKFMNHFKYKSIEIQNYKVNFQEVEQVA